MENIPFILLIMVFIAVFLLAQSFMMPVFGAERQAAKRLKRRLSNVLEKDQRQHAATMLRKKYLQELTPLERWLEALPGMAGLVPLIEQSGREMPAYRLVLTCLLLGAAAAWAAWMLTLNPYLTLLACVAACMVPVIRLNMERSQRMTRFEEQLPEALDVMVRALKAGHPFSGTLQLVADEMDEPISREYAITFADINYGLDVKQAFLNMLERIPNMTLMTLVTAVVVQRETGGNLTEILSNISAVIRGRFRLQRMVKTLSAEGRMSSWILALIPFLLFVGIMVTTPTYLPILIEEPLGIKIIAVSFVLQVIGILWLKKIIRINV